MPRNGSGVYTLPAGNPVVGGTTIEASWANPTLADIANEMTNSLSRNGNGGMLVPFKFADGSSATPGAAFSSEPGSGLYRAATADVRMAINGNDTVRWVDDTGTTPGLQAPLEIWDGLVWNAIIPFTATGAAKLAFLTVTQDVNLDTMETDTAANNAKNSYPTGDATKVGFISVTQAVNLDTMESEISVNNAKVTYPSADAAKVGFISVTQAVDLDSMETAVAANSLKITYPSADAAKVGFLSVTQAVNLDTMESNIAVNNAKVSYPPADASKLSGIAIGANLYVHPAHATTNINTSGAEVLDVLNTGADGHVTGMSKRTMTKTDLGLGNVANVVTTTSTSAPSGGNNGDIWLRY